MSAETSTAVAATAAALSAVAAIATALIAVRSLRATRLDSRQRSRPIVVVQLQRGVLAHVLDLVVTNYGASSARRVQLEFIPPLPPLEQLTRADHAYWLRKRYGRSLQVLAPGMQLSNVFKLPSETVDPLVVRVTYEDDDSERYLDQFLLDPTEQETETFAGPSDTNDRGLRLIRAVEALVRVTGHR